MLLVQRSEHALRPAPAIRPGEPLWKIAPTHDENGTALCDFMMLMPKLKSRQAEYIQHTQSHLAAVLSCYPEVVFANLDMRLNLLWVSHRHRRGLMGEMVTAIRLQVPEAVLVAHHHTSV